MDELNPEVRMYLDEARKVLKAHFLTRAEEVDPDFVREWEERIESMTDRDRRLVLDMLKKSLKGKKAK